MVIDNLNIGGAAGRPDKANAPLLLNRLGLRGQVRLLDNASARMAARPTHRLYGKIRSAPSSKISEVTIDLAFVLLNLSVTIQFSE